MGDGMEADFVFGDAAAAFLLRPLPNNAWLPSAPADRCEFFGPVCGARAEIVGVIARGVVAAKYMGPILYNSVG
jgi:hypothetical protein